MSPLAASYQLPNSPVPAGPLELVEHEIERRMDRARSPLQEVCRHAARGGSRIRASLVLAAAQDLGTSNQRTICAAAAIELLHAATLIQDDIFDAAALRRGHTSTYRCHGVPLATLASDWLFMESYQLAGEASPACLPLLLSISQDIVQAEALELAPESTSSFAAAWKQMLCIARGKTALLFGASLAASAMIAGTSLSEHQLLFQIGTDIGLTFQFADDVCDLFAPSEKIGKCAQQDLPGGKLTWPMLISSQSRASHSGKAWAGAKIERSEFARLMYSPPQAALLQEELLRRLSERWQLHLSELAKALPAGKTLLVIGSMLERTREALGQGCGI